MLWAVQYYGGFFLASVACSIDFFPLLSCQKNHFSWPVQETNEANSFVNCLEHSMVGSWTAYLCVRNRVYELSTRYTYTEGNCIWKPRVSAYGRKTFVWHGVDASMLINEENTKDTKSSLSIRRIIESIASNLEHACPVFVRTAQSNYEIGNLNYKYKCFLIVSCKYKHSSIA